MTENEETQMRLWCVVWSSSDEDAPGAGLVRWKENAAKLLRELDAEREAHVETALELAKVSADISDDEIRHGTPDPEGKRAETIRRADEVYRKAFPNPWRERAEAAEAELVHLQEQLIAMTEARQASINLLIEACSPRDGRER